MAFDRPGLQRPELASRPVIDPRVRELHRRRGGARRGLYWTVMIVCLVALGVGVRGIIWPPGPSPWFTWLALGGLIGVLVAQRWIRPPLERMARSSAGRPILQECPMCGYATVSPHDHRCPECGASGLGTFVDSGDPDAPDAPDEPELPDDAPRST